MTSCLGGESKRRRNPSRMGPMKDLVSPTHHISYEPRSLGGYCPKLVRHFDSTLHNPIVVHISTYPWPCLVSLESIRPPCSNTSDCDEPYAFGIILYFPLPTSEGRWWASAVGQLGKHSFVRKLNVYQVVFHGTTYRFRILIQVLQRHPYILNFTEGSSGLVRALRTFP
ncbi:hypothetical protein EDC04DRAFT_119024 [Pisolithus marmoratus]|nr:hypothetical protein EDC04DRAFT_119024 [Pisolithus marmoratus]